MPTKIIQFSEIVTDYLSDHFSSCLGSRFFSDELKLAEVVLVCTSLYWFVKRMIKRIEAITDPSAFFRIPRKVAKDVFKHS